MKKLRTFFKGTYLGIMLIFLYAPIAVLMVYSFNDSKTMGNWSGFSLKWYEQLINDSTIMDALGVTLSVAVISAVAATIIGTFAAIGMHSMKKGRRLLIENVSQLPMINPDLVTGISLMMLFSFIGISQHNSYLRLCIAPGIVSGFILAFTLSLDDFVISYFAQQGQQNLSIYIYSMARKGISPKINALSTLMFMAVLTLLLIVNFKSVREERKAAKEAAKLKG